MATPESLYYQSTDHRGYPMFPARDRTGVPSTSVVTPKIPQLPPTQHRQNHHQQGRHPPGLQPTVEFRSEPSNHHDARANVGKSLPGNYDVHAAAESTRQNVRPLSRSENLKRRSSLREVTRCIKGSKVAKRLRRQGKGEFEVEDEGDAGVSASENEMPKTMVCKRRSSPSPSVSTQDDRRFSSVSTLMDGMESSLSLKTPGRGRGSSTASQASSLMMDNSDSASTHTNLTTLSSSSRKSYDGDREDIDGIDDDDSDRIDKRTCSIIALGPEQPQLFACPYAKHDPKRYSAANLDELNYRGCSQSYLTDLARVKQHLYRVHERPQHHCPTCFETFKNQSQCMKHYEQRSCRTRPCPFNEKMSADQLTAIKKKNRGTDPYLGWYEIYKTLFSGTHLPMSPYAAFTATTDTLETFMDFVIRELPARLHQRLGFNTTVDDAVQSSLPDALREIRREFSSLGQHRPDSRAPNRSDETPTIVAHGDDTSDDINFHQMVTLKTATKDSLHSGRPPVIELPPPELYVFPSQQSGQMFSPPEPLEMQYHESQSQQSAPPQYPQMQYNIQPHGMMQNGNAGPITAIFHPSDRDGQPDYFLNQHQGQEILPVLRIEAANSWLPTMISTIPDPSMGGHGISSMMGGYYHGAFNN